MTVNDRLKKRLRNARIECPGGSGSYMVPRCQQEQLITEETIMHETQMKGVLVSIEEARSIRKTSIQLFGTLALLQKEETIVDFIAEGITDEHLPFKRIMDHWREYYLKSQNGEPIKTLDDWEDDEREDFYNSQQVMTAPVFKLLGHYNFEESTVLPFIDYPAVKGESKDYRGGGYSEMHIRCIHPSHHDFWDCTQAGVSAPYRTIMIYFVDLETGLESSCSQEAH
jgi:hypothetical protein